MENHPPPADAMTRPLRSPPGGHGGCGSGQNSHGPPPPGGRASQPPFPLSPAPLAEPSKSAGKAAKGTRGTWRGQQLVWSAVASAARPRPVQEPPATGTPSRFVIHFTKKRPGTNPRLLDRPRPECTCGVIAGGSSLHGNEPSRDEGCSSGRWVQGVSPRAVVHPAKAARGSNPPFCDRKRMTNGPVPKSR